MLTFLITLFTRVLDGLVAVVGTGAVVATLLPLLRREAWWIRVFDFPRLQVVGALAVALVGALLLNFWQFDWLGPLFVLTLAGAIVYQVIRILPYTHLLPKKVLDSSLPTTDNDNHLSLLVTNVLMTNRDASRCLGVIRHCNPDVILAVETDQWWLEQLRSLEETHPYTAYAPLPNTYGMLVFSRLPLLNPEIKFLLDDDIPSFHAFVEMPNGLRVRLYCLHPKPPAPQESKTSTKRDAELLLVGHEIEDHDGPTVVAGDMNDVAWSHTSELFRRISRLLDPRMGRGLLPTFHADYRLLRWPLDHVFHSAHFKVASIERLPHVGSDHFPIYIRLSYEPHAKMQHMANMERPDEGDFQEAAEKIQKGFEEETEEESAEVKGQPQPVPLELQQPARPSAP
ncbi:endonuclease/exonuclease/phosphatase family protein [Hymenobacter oligotrophus]|uniref:endonuclease/exonuclease/phosphatase family protein n=1 Tax=Hymenobacter oligotrophus TaxID=2319843 RepID=UPI001969346B|nr:endonuclease/exonuclease/phosphatase family protein [Hymenobacter oligotrophus]